MISLTIDESKTNFVPGELIAGNVTWAELSSSASHFEVRLIWYTAGKGTRDVEVVSTSTVNCANQLKGTSRFEMIAPHRPYSCAGSLLSIVWAVELILFPNQESTRIEICISPTGEPVALQNDYSDQAKATPSFKMYRFNSSS